MKPCEINIKFGISKKLFRFKSSQISKQVDFYRGREEITTNVHFSKDCQGTFYTKIKSKTVAGFSEDQTLKSVVVILRLKI